MANREPTLAERQINEANYAEDYMKWYWTARQQRGDAIPEGLDLSAIPIKANYASDGEYKKAYLAWLAPSEQILRDKAKSNLSQTKDRLFVEEQASPGDSTTELLTGLARASWQKQQGQTSGWASAFMMPTKPAQMAAASQQQAPVPQAPVANKPGQLFGSRNKTDVSMSQPGSFLQAGPIGISPWQQQQKKKKTPGMGVWGRPI